MSDPSGSTALVADVTAALAAYDTARSAEVLRHAADILVRDDGVIPGDPATAMREAHTRLQLWLTLLGRFRRDLDPGFDPDNPPSSRPKSPIVNGQPLPPWAKPSDLADPVARKQLEDATAAAAARAKQFDSMYDLFELHKALLNRAVDSLRNARATLGLAAADLIAALGDADITSADRAALLASAAD